MELVNKLVELFLAVFSPLQLFVEQHEVVTPAIDPLTQDEVQDFAVVLIIPRTEVVTVFKNK